MLKLEGADWAGITITILAAATCYPSVVFIMVYEDAFFA
jgi:hypothetical protein